MSKQTPQIGINMSYSTKNRLSRIRFPNESYDHVLCRLLYLEEKYNAPALDLTREYKISYGNLERLLRIRWQHDSYYITYYNTVTHEWSESAKAWYVVDDFRDVEVVDMIVDKFISLMSRDNVRALLVDLKGSLDLDGFIVSSL